MVGVPVGVDDQGEVVGVSPDPGGGLLGVADEPAVDQRRPPAGQEQQVGVRERPRLPDQPGRKGSGPGGHEICSYGRDPDVVRAAIFITKAIPAG
jgi:hypothetical protein